MDDKTDYSNDLVSFDIPIAGVQHALRDNVTEEWSVRKELLERHIKVGQRVKLKPEPKNRVDPLAIQAFYDYDGSGSWQPVGRVGTDYVCRVRALFGGKAMLTATLIRWEELNGHPDIPVGTIWVQVNAPRSIVKPNREIERIKKFDSSLSELLSPLPVRQEEENLEILCDDILEETDEKRLIDLARRYLKQMDTSFASDDRYYYLAIVHHLQSFTNEQLNEVTAAILHNRHNYDAKSKPLDIYRRQMEHVREAIQSAHGMAEQFCRMYETDRKREELMDKLKEPLQHEFSRAFPIDCDEVEKSFANRLFYGRYSRTDLYAIYCHIALIEHLQENNKCVEDNLHVSHDEVSHEENELCIALNKYQREILNSAERENIIKYNPERKGYDTGHQSSKVLVAYLCGRLSCGDYTSEDGTWIDGGRFEEAKYYKELFGFDVDGTRRKARDKGAGLSPTGHERVDKLFI